jgi:hypothetical protein
MNTQNPQDPKIKEVRDKIEKLEDEIKKIEAQSNLDPKNRMLEEEHKTKCEELEKLRRDNPDIFAPRIK